MVSSVSYFNDRNHCLCESSVEVYAPPTSDRNDGNQGSFLCSACIRRGLEVAWQQRQATLERHERIQKDCASRLDQLSQQRLQLAQLQDESSQLRDRLLQLRSQASDLACAVARGAIQVESCQQQLQTRSRFSQDRQRLHQLGSAFCGGMTEAIHGARLRSQLLRFSWALQALQIHRLDVAEADAQDRIKVAQGRMKHARGIGKIGGLPLPHAGPELFGVLPPPELVAALRLVASVTSLVARCLNIQLPHPILLRLEASPSDIAGQEVVVVAHVPATDANSKSVESSDFLSSSTSSLASLLRGPSQSFFSRAVRGTGVPLAAILEESASKAIVVPPPSMDPAIVQRRLKHASAAVLAEDSSEGSSRYALATEVMNQDEFAIALQLLQDNLIVLCIRAGVVVDRLWPAEALLLNLHELYNHCKEQVYGKPIPF